MSRVDTTSFAEILTRSLGQGANMAQNAASLQQRRKEAEAQQAFQQQQFAANEAQRAFGNDMQTQRLGLDQLQFQTMTDRIAREQAAEEEDRMMGGAVGASSGVFDGYLRLAAQQNNGVPPPDDVMRVRKWTEKGIGTRALTTLRDVVQKGADLSEMKAKTQRLGGLVDNMMADPKNEKARPALELIKEMTLDPQTQGTAIREAFGVIQQQQAAQQAAAEQQQRLQLAGVLTGGGQLTPDQSLIVMDDPALRRMQEQRNQPVPPDPQVVAQLFTRANQGDTAARAQLIQLGQLTPSAAFGGQRDSGIDRGAIKDEIDVLNDQIKELTTSLNDKLSPDGTVKRSVSGEGFWNARDSNAGTVEQQAARLQELTARRDAVRSQLIGGQSSTREPVLLSELDAAKKQTVDQIRDSLIQRLGRVPTREEMKAALSMQSMQPQAPR